MASLTVENYLKTIYQIINGQDGRPATTGQVSSALGVAPGTVTSMLKTLDAAQLAAHRPYEGVVLLPAGEALALRVLRRHRLLELFLMRTLDMTWDEVHDEAEHMEHAVSDLLVERMDAFLGRPDVDPHGDPIPRTDGRLREEPPTRTLAECVQGETFTLARVLDQSPEFLRYLTEMGLTLGVAGTVAENPHGAGVMLIHVDQRPIAMSLETAASLAVSAES
ncbi:MAG: metal-dependent transcriptional regulator [Pirellulales bacterium]|nr:metal-dependent transcriptional regulator [Pirellulales bacterium]